MSTKVNLSKSKVELKDYVEVKGHKYFIDNNKVVLELTKKEIATAVWLAKKLNNKWDLKNVISNRNDAIRNRIKNQENQAPNFIIDISKSKITLKSAEKQSYHIYELKGYKWVKSIILKKNNEMKIVHKKS